MTSSNNPDAKGEFASGNQPAGRGRSARSEIPARLLPHVRNSPRPVLGGIDHTDERTELARVALEKAEEIQPDAGEVHWMKGIYAYHGFRDYDRP